jgi:hypothetical protein
MRIFHVPSLAAAVAATGLLLAVAHPASAQQDASSNTRPDITIRLGGYFTSNSTVSHTVGSSYLCGGIDYDIKSEVGTTRTILSADYISRSSGSNHLRIFPITVGQLIMGTTNNGITPYYGVGMGGYFVNQDIASATTGNGSQDYVAFGGYAAVGFEYNRYLLVDARYHLVTPSHGINVDGLELTAGLRF